MTLLEDNPDSRLSSRIFGGCCCCQVTVNLGPIFNGYKLGQVRAGTLYYSYSWDSVLRVEQGLFIIARGGSLQCTTARAVTVYYR